MIFMCLRGMSILRFERMKKKLFFHVYRELGHDGEDSPPCMYHVSDTGELSAIWTLFLQMALREVGPELRWGDNAYRGQSWYSKESPLVILCNLLDMFLPSSLDCHSSCYS
jgi:hypothetical protein